MHEVRGQPTLVALQGVCNLMSRSAVEAFVILQPVCPCSEITYEKEFSLTAFSSQVCSLVDIKLLTCDQRAVLAFHSKPRLWILAPVSERKAHKGFANTSRSIHSYDKEVTLSKIS